MIEQTRRMTCDHCEKQADLAGIKANRRPAGWSRIRIPRDDNGNKHAWNTKDLCPECAAEIRRFVGERQDQ